MRRDGWVSDEIAAEHGASLVRLFSTSVVKDLAATGRSALAAQILKETRTHSLLRASASLGDALDSLLLSLFRSYRSEYVYKNAIANRILLGRHSLSTAFMVTEFRALDCKADCVVLNGSSHVYEVKSEFDSMARIRRQVGAYGKVFDRINVITSDAQVAGVLGEVDESVGVLVLTDRHSIHSVREAQSHRAHVDPSAVFDSLSLGEYARIIREHFGSVPSVPRSQLYRVCKELFTQLAPETAHDSMVSALRRRGNCHSLRQFVASVPFSLKAASIASRLTQQEQTAFVGLLHCSARHALLSA